MAVRKTLTMVLALESLLLIIGSLADVRHMSLTGVHARLERPSEGRPILYLNRNSSADRLFLVATDAYRALAFGDDAAQHARPVAPERHLYSVS